MVFIPAIKHIKYFHGSTQTYLWKSNGTTSEVSIENITESGSNFESTFVDHHSWRDINFNGHYLIKNDISIPIKAKCLVTIQFFHTERDFHTEFTLSNYLFGSVRLTRNT